MGGGIYLNKIKLLSLYGSLMGGLFVAGMSIVSLLLNRIDLLTFIGFLGLGVTLISWYINTARIYKRIFQEFIFELIDKYKLNKDERTALHKVIGEPITLLELENKAPLMEGLDGLIDKEIIGKKLIQQLDGKKIYVYYFSPSFPNDLSFRV